jgi:hypothetical protein
MWPCVSPLRHTSSRTSACTELRVISPDTSGDAKGQRWMCTVLTLYDMDAFVPERNPHFCSLFHVLSEWMWIIYKTETTEWCLQHCWHFERSTSQKQHSQPRLQCKYYSTKKFAASWTETSQKMQLNQVPPLHCFGIIFFHFESEVL